MTAVVLAQHEWTPSGTSVPSQAPVAVLIHGLSGWHRTWWRMGPALAERGWRVLAVDGRGHGHSPRIGTAATLDDLAGDVEAAIGRFTEGDVDLLLGHSLGAVVAMAIAARRPELVRRVVLEDPPSIDRTADEGFLTSIVEGNRAAREHPAEEIERALRDNRAWQRLDAEHDVEGRALADSEGLVQLMRRPRPFAVADVARTLPMPALYLLAAEPRSVLVGPARNRLRRDHPEQARLVEMDAGHMLHRDRFDDYLATLLEWLSAPPR